MADLEKPSRWRRMTELIHVGGSLTAILAAVGPSLLALAAGLLIVVALIPRVPLTFYAAGFATALMVGSILTAISAVNRQNRRIALDINPDWLIVQSDRKAYVHSPFDVDYEHEVVAVSRRNGLDTLCWQTMWTGTGEYRVVPQEKGLSHHEDPLNTAYGERFRLILAHPVPKGTRQRFRFKIETRATDRPKPFLSTSIRHNNWPKAGCKLEVQFAPGVEVDGVWAEEYVEGMSWPTSTESLTLDGNRLASFPFRKKLGRRFVLGWSYKEAIPHV